MAIKITRVPAVVAGGTPVATIASVATTLRVAYRRFFPNDESTDEERALLRLSPAVLFWKAEDTLASAHAAWACADRASCVRRLGEAVFLGACALVSEYGRVRSRRAVLRAFRDRHVGDGCFTRADSVLILWLQELAADAAATGEVDASDHALECGLTAAGELLARVRGHVVLLRSPANELIVNRHPI